MPKPKKHIDPPVLDDPPSKTDYLEAVKQILTPDRAQVKGENREPTVTELEAKHRLIRNSA